MNIDELHLALVRSGRRSRADGLTSVFENANGQEVGGAQARYTSSPTLGPQDVEGLLAHDWRARREITQPAGDLIREGVDVEGLPDWVDADSLRSWIEGDSIRGDKSAGLLRALGDWWAEGEAYGGAILVAILDDGLHPSEPVDPTKIVRVRSWQVLDRWCVWPYRSGGVGAPVDYWLISAHRGRIPGIDSSHQIVHPSRVVAHTGLWMPGRWVDHNNGWGLSRLELLRDQRDTLATGHGSLGRLLTRSSQDVVTLSELSEFVDEVGTDYVSAKIAQMKSSLHSLGLLVLDGGIEARSGDGGDTGRLPDSFATMGRQLSGATDIPELQHTDWRRGSTMPAVIADGEVSGGLNSGEDAGAWRSWGGTIAAEQKNSLTAALNWGLGLIFASREGPSGGRVPETWESKWRPIAEPDYEAEARVGEIEARTDAILLDAGILTDREVRKWRSVDGKHGAVRVEKEEILEDPTDADIAAEKLAAVEAELELARLGQQGQQPPPAPEDEEPPA